MLRSALLWASRSPALAERLPRYRFVQRATRRFMPGESLADALAAAEALEERDLPTTLTRLGENVEDEAAADAVVEHYLKVMEEVRTRGLDTEISVKLTQLGLDRSLEAARGRLAKLVRAGDPVSLVWIDMEDSSYVDRTLEIFQAVREDHANVGVCLQAYLRRTADDLEALLPLHPAVRLVKGAYREPEEVAFAGKDEVDRSFVTLAGRMLRERKAGRIGRPVLGTHDDRMIAEATRMAHELELDPQAWEVAMLYGIRREEQARLRRRGYGVRVLISYGEHWFPWYMRRLAERPANVWFVLKQLAG